MTATAVRAELERLGSDQTRRIYVRHGVNPPLYGVKWGDMRKLAKSLGTDHELAMRLWEAGEHESRLLALMTADPDRATAADLQAMVHEIDNYVEIDEFAAYVAKTPYLEQLADNWTDATGEWISACAWTLVAQQALRTGGPTNAYFIERLKQIEAGVGTAPNRTRHTMNGALIAIGSRNTTLRKRATATARRIGNVDVDHGETSCVTPEAAPYIDRIWARRS
jgi:3-methyladenine DNA glycosylase AlkD